MKIIPLMLSFKVGLRVLIIIHSLILTNLLSPLIDSVVKHLAYQYANSSKCILQFFMNLLMLILEPCRFLVKFLCALRTVPFGVVL